MRADRFRIRKTAAENSALTLSNGRIVEIVDGSGLPTGALYIHDGTTAGGVVIAGSGSPGGGTSAVNLPDETPASGDAGGSTDPLIGRTPLGSLWWWDGSAWSQLLALLALLLATLAANAADPLPKYVKTPLTTNSLGTAATWLTAREFLNLGTWVSVIDYGATSGDASDDTTAFNNALSSGASTVVVPAGSYIVGGVDIPSNVRLVGMGMPLLTYVANDTMVLDTATAPATNYTIANFRIAGPDITDPTSVDATPETRGSTFGILAQTWGANRIQNVDVYGFEAAGIRCVQGGLGGANDKFANLQISQVKSWWNNVGIEFVEAAEYSTIADSITYQNSTNLQIMAGNVFITGVRATDGHVGIHISGTGNNAHGSAVGCEFNHNTVANVYVEDTATGFIFSGCNLWSEEIYLDNCGGVIFSGCNGSPNVIYARTDPASVLSGYNLFENCVFSVQPALYLQNNGSVSSTNSWDYVDFKNTKIRGNSTTAVQAIGLSKGLQAYWPMNEYGGTRIDRVAGTAMLESAATIYSTNAPWTTVSAWANLPDRSAVLSDASLYAPGTGPRLAAGNTTWTVAGWFYLVDTDNQVLVSKCNPAGSMEWFLCVTNDATPFFNLKTFDASGNLVADVSTTASRAASVGWHHVTVWHDTGTGTGKLGLHVNVSNSYAASENNTAVQSASLVPLRVGGLDDGTQTSTAWVRDLAVWDRVLTTTEIWALHNGYRKRFILGE